MSTDCYIIGEGIVSDPSASIQIIDTSWVNESLDQRVNLCPQVVARALKSRDLPKDKRREFLQSFRRHMRDSYGIAARIPYEKE